MIFAAFLKALGQIGDARFQRVLWTGVAASLGLLAGLSWFIVRGLRWLIGDQARLPLVGDITWLSDLLNWGMIPIMLGLSIFLMVPVASAISSMFLDQVAQAVEDRHFPALPPAHPVSFIDSVVDTVSFLGVMVLANLVALFLYIILAPFAPFIFWGLNGFLLGREYFTLVAIRRVGRIEAKRLRSVHGPRIWAAGILMALPLSIPLLNLLVPIVGAATFTHLYHKLVGRLG